MRAESDLLVARPRHLGVLREVHPELDHLHGAALRGEVALVLLLVDDAGGGGHPLDVAGSELAGVAGGVAVLELALVDDRDGLEAAVRVLADAAGRAVGPNWVGPA
jgi:hypothetical protein